MAPGNQLAVSGLSVASTVSLPVLESVGLGGLGGESVPEDFPNSLDAGQGRVQTTDGVRVLPRLSLRTRRLGLPLSWRSRQSASGEKRRG